MTRADGSSSTFSDPLHSHNGTRTRALRRRSKELPKTADATSSSSAMSDSAVRVEDAGENHANTGNDKSCVAAQHTESPLEPAPPRSLDDFLTIATEEHVFRVQHSSTHCPHRSCQYPFSYWMVFLSLGVANSSDAAEILCLSYILSKESFQETILLDSAWRGGLLAATVFCGMLIGGLLVGALGDDKGRRPMLLMGLFTNTCSGLLSALAWNVWTLSALRLIAGIGIGATVPPLFTLCSELAPPADRGFWVTVAASFWMVGSTYVALVGWWLLAPPENGWRLFAAVCAIPSACGFILVYRFVPESPRFLALKGNHDRAIVVAQQLADALEYSGPPLSSEELIEFYPIASDGTNITDVEDSSSNGAAAFRSDQNGTTPVTAASIRLMGSRRPPLVAMIQAAWDDFLLSSSKLYTPGLKVTTFGLQTVWFSLSFGSYGLMTWINTLFFEVHLKNVYFNALLFALSNLPGNLISAYLMDKTGRTNLLIGSILAAALSLVAFAYVAATDNDESTAALSRNWIVAAACSFQCFTIAAWNSIDVLTSELFPTTVRSTGMGICAASGRIGAMVAQFVNGSLVSHPVRLLLVAATTLSLGAMTPKWFLPADSTGQPVHDRVSDTNYRPTPSSQSLSQRRQRRSSSELFGDRSLGGFSLPEQPFQNDTSSYSYEAVQRGETS